MASGAPARKRRRAETPHPAHLWFRRPSVVWFRGHDLRVEDHPALLAAAQRGGPVAPLFIVEPSAAKLGDCKRWWLKRSLAALTADLSALGVDLVVRVGDPATELRAFIRDTGADAVFWNRVYEPDLLRRDERLRVALAGDRLTAVSLKAELLVEPWELSDDRELLPNSAAAAAFAARTLDANANSAVAAPKPATRARRRRAQSSVSARPPGPDSPAAPDALLGEHTAENSTGDGGSTRRSERDRTPGAESAVDEKSLGASADTRNVSRHGDKGKSVRHARDACSTPDGGKTVGAGSRSERQMEGTVPPSGTPELCNGLSDSSSGPAPVPFRTFHDYMRAWMAFPPPPTPFSRPTRLTPLPAPVTSVPLDDAQLETPEEVNSALASIWTPGSAQAGRQLDTFLHEVFPAFGEERCRRDFRGTSRLSPHVRFGELSPRKLYHEARVRVSKWDPGAERLSDTFHSATGTTSSNPQPGCVRASADYVETSPQTAAACREKEPLAGARKTSCDGGGVGGEVSNGPLQARDSRDRMRAATSARPSGPLASERGRASPVRSTSDHSASGSGCLRRKSSKVQEGDKDCSGCQRSGHVGKDRPSSFTSGGDTGSARPLSVKSVASPHGPVGVAKANGVASEPKVRCDGSRDSAPDCRKKLDVENDALDDAGRNGRVSPSVTRKRCQGALGGYPSSTEERVNAKTSSDREGIGTRSLNGVVGGGRRRQGPEFVSSISHSARAFLKNLCLRDFGYHVLFHHPDFEKRPMVAEFGQFPWAPDEGSFEKWRTGATGYPIVDAGMRALRTTGWIHNGMRFLLASFLTKYLLLPWQRGLAEFFSLLLDGDHSSNPLGWQWTAGSNTDAFPFSCLVNPVKFGLRQDPVGSYVRRWVPELDKLPTEYIHQPWRAPKHVLESAGVVLGQQYPFPVVNIGDARTRARDAMLVMRRIFSSLRPRRELASVPVESLIREWPEDPVDTKSLPSPPIGHTLVEKSSKTSLDSAKLKSVGYVDARKNEANGYSYGGGNGLVTATVTSDPQYMAERPSSTLDGCKPVLLPSLWSLLHYPEPPADLPHASPSLDQLIAVDTACLTDGALPLDSDGLADQRSIESALLSAHAGGEGHGDVGPSGDGDGDIVNDGLAHRGDGISKDKMDAIMEAHGSEHGVKPDTVATNVVDGNLSRMHDVAEQQAFDVNRVHSQPDYTSPIDAEGDQEATQYAQQASHQREETSGMHLRHASQTGLDPQQAHVGELVRNGGFASRGGHGSLHGGIIHAEHDQPSSDHHHHEQHHTQGQQQHQHGQHQEHGDHDLSSRTQATVPPSAVMVSSSGLMATSGMSSSGLEVDGHAQVMVGSAVGTGNPYSTPASYPPGSLAPLPSNMIDSSQAGQGNPSGMDSSSAALYAQHVGLGSFYGVAPSGMPVVNGQALSGAYDVNSMNHITMQAMLAFGYGGVYSTSGGLVDPSAFAAPSVPNFSGIAPGSAPAYMQVPTPGVPLPGPGSNGSSAPQYGGQPVYYNPHAAAPSGGHLASQGDITQHVEQLGVSNAQVAPAVPGRGSAPSVPVADGNSDEALRSSGSMANLPVPSASMRDMGARMGLDVTGTTRDMNGGLGGILPPPSGLPAAYVPPPNALPSTPVDASTPPGMPTPPTRRFPLPLARGARVSKGPAGGGRGKGESGRGRRGGDMVARSPRQRPRSASVLGAGGVSGGGAAPRSSSKGSRVHGGVRSGKGSSVSTSGVAGASSTPTPNEGAAEPLALGDRQTILQNILRDEKHEFHAFAKFLRDTYVLTEHTDRHSSKDYIRLCTLKDDFHKECHDDKDKLKIYKVKSFFSKVLKLEVTGEWDRHGHGGIRGPWVYGIRRNSER